MEKPINPACRFRCGCLRTVEGRNVCLSLYESGCEAVRLTREAMRGEARQCAARSRVGISNSRPCCVSCRRAVKWSGLDMLWVFIRVGNCFACLQSCCVALDGSTGPLVNCSTRACNTARAVGGLDCSHYSMCASSGLPSADWQALRSTCL